MAFGYIRWNRIQSRFLLSNLMVEVDTVCDLFRIVEWSTFFCRSSTFINGFQFLWTKTFIIISVVAFHTTRHLVLSLLIKFFIVFFLNKFWKVYMLYTIFFCSQLCAPLQHFGDIPSCKYPILFYFYFYFWIYLWCISYFYMCYLGNNNL